MYFFFTCSVKFTNFILLGMSIKQTQLENMLKSKSEATILIALKHLKNQSRKSCLVQDNRIFALVFEQLASKCGNILNASLSIIANLCLYENPRRMFRQHSGVHYLTAILKKQYLALTNEVLLPNENIDVGSDQFFLEIKPDHALQCRAWRLASNLAKSFSLCKELVNKGLLLIIFQYLKVSERLSNETYSMILRTIT